MSERGDLVKLLRDHRVLSFPECDAVADELERAKKIEDAARAALEVLAGQIEGRGHRDEIPVHNALAAALTPDPAPTVTEAMDAINKAVKEGKPR